MAAPGMDITGLVKFSQSGSWKDRFQERLEEHTGPVLEALGLENLDDLVRIIGPQWGMSLWGCAFEDLVNRTYQGGEEDGNIVDVFLKRRGWKEKLLTRSCLKNMKTAIITLYEVTAVVPGVSLTVRDRLKAGVPDILVHEKTATTMVSPGDAVSGRVFESAKKNVFAGGLLPFSEKMQERLFQALKDHFKKDAPYTQDELVTAAPLFSRVWLEGKMDELITEGEKTLETADPATVERMTALAEKFRKG